MKTESKNVRNFIFTENEESLKEFEMIELKGGNSELCASKNISCKSTNKNCPDSKCCSSFDSLRAETT